jgi:hypothetical protein
LSETPKVISDQIVPSQNLLFEGEMYRTLQLNHGMNTPGMKNA